ncbi:mucosa-associated lymphoid tissue lymphoma translocation protein 1 [Bicyclus anynana]|uniref:Mucosa-associated lymphoid tissue lymphoma translocation protein 1 n=1 Tax=Bicyclus anynana TaxID=110368 RepID=A0A6J1MWH6_BICAN|nr:mucosa-associated lymphoid tissue lymphoma translocation protein 1 [Bicyclus anynana]
MNSKMSYPEPLIKVLSPQEQKDASKFSEDVCKKIAAVAGVNIVFQGQRTAGEELLKNLDRRGHTYEQYISYLNLVNRQAYYRPEAKVAILIANEKYEHLSKLVTPSIDCEALGNSIRELDFITVFISNTKSDMLKEILMKTFSLIPENSYCFIFYAGHGCELITTKCILSIDCPSENIEFDHCVTENWLLRELAKCKPELCVLIMDMCRVNLDRQTNQEIYRAIPHIEEYTIHSNLLISYSTQSANAAYECIWVEKSETIGDTSYSVKSTDVVCGGGSQYVNALWSRLCENDVDISTMLDNVHGDVENSVKHQRPIKVQCGVSKRYLSDSVEGNTKELWSTLKGALEKYQEYCSVCLEK